MSSTLPAAVGVCSVVVVVVVVVVVDDGVVVVDDGVVVGDDGVVVDDVVIGVDDVASPLEQPTMANTSASTKKDAVKMTLVFNPSSF